VQHPDTEPEDPILVPSHEGGKGIMVTVEKLGEQVGVPLT
jgi:hypothetical protein